MSHKTKRNFQQDLSSNRRISSVLNFQRSLDGKLGPADFFNYNFRTKHFWFFFTRPIIKFLINRGWRYKVEGKENIPKYGPYVVMPNHVSHFDSFLILPHLTRTPVAIADEKLFRNKYFRVIAKMYNGFPVRKGTKSTDIIEYSASRINNGDTMIWFPEGQRHKNPSENKLNPGKLGSGMLVHSLRSGIPVIPAFIEGSEFAMPVGKRLSTGRGPRSLEITVKFGKPIYFDEFRRMEKCKETSQKIVDKIMMNIEKLRPSGPYKVQRTK